MVKGKFAPCSHYELKIFTHKKGYFHSHNSVKNIIKQMGK